MPELTRIYPTANAPYAARFVTDDFAVEYRYSLWHGLFRARVLRREGDGIERFLVERTTRNRTVEEITPDHAQRMIDDFKRSANSGILRP